MPDSAQADSVTNQQATNDGSSLALLEPFDTARLVRGFCALGVLVVVGDLATTVYGLEIGLREQNPFVAGVMERYGVAGLVALKCVAIGWVAVIWRALGRRYGVAAMAGLMLPQGVAVALNVFTIVAA